MKRLLLAWLVVGGVSWGSGVKAQFDERFSTDPSLSDWVLNEDATWVAPPGVAPPCADPNAFDPDTPCSVYTETIVEQLGETVEDFGGYVLVTPAEGGSDGNVFRTVTDRYESFELDVVVELRDGTVNGQGGAEGLAVVIVGGEEPPSRRGTGGGGLGAPCVGATGREPMLVFEVDSWGDNVGDRNVFDHLAFAYSRDGFVCTDSIPPQAFAPIDPAVAPLRNKQPPPADPNRLRMTIRFTTCDDGATVDCSLEALDHRGGVDFGRVYTAEIPDFEPFDGYFGVTATTGGAWQNHILHSARLEMLTEDACEPSEVLPRFVRGDVDGSGFLDVTDGIITLRWLGLAGNRPQCLDAADVDDSGEINITDPIVIFGWLFLGDMPPALPSPSRPIYAPEDCGPDETPDDQGFDLDCRNVAAKCAP